MKPGPNAAVSPGAVRARNLVAPASFPDAHAAFPPWVLPLVAGTHAPRRAALGVLGVPGRRSSPVMADELADEEPWREDVARCYGMADVIDYLRDFERTKAERPARPEFEWTVNKVDACIQLMELGPRECVDGSQQNLSEQSVVGALLVAIALDLAANPPAAIDELDDSNGWKYAFATMILLTVTVFIMMILCSLYIVSLSSKTSLDADLFKSGLHVGASISFIDVFRTGLYLFYVGECEPARAPDARLLLSSPLGRGRLIGNGSSVLMPSAWRALPCGWVGGWVGGGVGRGRRDDIFHRLNLNRGHQGLR